MLTEADLLDRGIHSVARTIRGARQTPVLDGPRGIQPSFWSECPVQAIVSEGSTELDTTSLATLRL